MTQVVECIAKLIEVARRMKVVADELHQPELKSQLVDEISILQELREELNHEPPPPPQPQPQGFARSQGHGSHEAHGANNRPTKLVAGAGMTVFQPTGDEGTYGIKEEEPPPPAPPPTAAPAATASKEAVPKATGTLKPPVPTPVAKSAAAVPPVSAEKRSQLAELRISELEPQQQSILNQMNDLLTDEQKRARAQATRSAKEAGKSGAELQQIINTAMNLTADQKGKWTALKKELHTIRTEIAQQVQFLLSDDQKASIDSPDS